MATELECNNLERSRNDDEDANIDENEEEEDETSRKNKIEDKKAVYTDELAEIYKQKKGKPPTTDAIKKTCLTELKNNGLIDEFDFSIDKRKKRILSHSRYRTICKSE